MNFFSHRLSFRYMVLVTFSGNDSYSILITFFILDRNILPVSGYFFFSFSVSLFISESILKYTFPSSTYCCCMSSFVLSFFGNGCKFTLLPFPNDCSSAVSIIDCLVTSANSFLNAFSAVAFFIPCFLTLTDSFLNSFSSVAFIVLGLLILTYPFSSVFSFVAFLIFFPNPCLIHGLTNTYLWYYLSFNSPGILISLYYPHPS